MIGNNYDPYLFPHIKINRRNEKGEREGEKIWVGGIV